MTDTSGLTSQTPFAFYDPDSRSLRTSQGTFPWDSTPCSVTLPRSGAMASSGQLFERPTLALPTDESACSSLLPTPKATNNENRQSLDRYGMNLGMALTALLPTPAANDSGNTPEKHLRKKPGREVVTSLQIIVDHGLLSTGGRLPTPPPSSDGSTSPDEPAPTQPTTAGSRPASWSG